MAVSDRRLGASRRSRLDRRLASVTPGAARLLFAVDDTNKQVKVLDYDAWLADNATAWALFSDETAQAPTAGARPFGLFYDDRGLWVADETNGDVYLFTYDGSGDRADPASYTRTRFYDHDSQIRAVCRGGGHVYMADSGGFGVERVVDSSPAANSAVRVGDYTGGKGTPQGVVAVGTDLYVAVWNNTAGNGSTSFGGLCRIDLNGTLGLGVTGTLVDGVRSTYHVGTDGTDFVYGYYTGSTWGARHYDGSAAATLTADVAGLSTGYASSAIATAEGVAVIPSTGVGGGVHLWDLATQTDLGTIATAGWSPLGVCLYQP